MLISRSRVARTVIIAAAALALTACSANVTTPEGSSPPAHGGALPGAETPQPSATPSPGSTLSAPDELPPVESGLELVLVVSASADDSIPDAVTEAASGLDATVRTVDAEPSTVTDDLVAAAEDADVVLVAGPDLLVSVDAVSSQILDTEFLVIGAQLPEPTGNVTAVVWPGADSRTAGQTASADLVERVPAALSTGLAMISDGGSGMVYELLA